jgi:hypothetical protein
MTEEDGGGGGERRREEEGRGEEEGGGRGEMESGETFKKETKVEFNFQKFSTNAF